MNPEGSRTLADFARGWREGSCIRLAAAAGLSGSLALLVMLVLYPPAVTATSDADDLLVVDCLLPGQIRQLGRKTYLGARRPVKTTARDCQIRGGEYVAYDRANYATALNVWLPRAKDGDAEAMVNVGEIYEKGLGLSPDYQAAAHWYRQAAEAGNARAQINLGNLYEKGLGVGRNPAEALNWYRRASGLPDNLVIDPGNIDSPEPGAASAQKTGDADFQREVERLRAETEVMQQELQRTRRQLEVARGELQQQRRTTQETARISPEEAARQAQFAADIEAKERQLAALKSEINRHRAQTGTLQSDLEATLEELDLAKTTLEQSRLEAGIQRTELQQARAKLSAYEQSTATDRSEVARLEQLWRQREAELDRQHVEIQHLQARIQEMQQEAAANRERLAVQDAYQTAIQQGSMAGPSITMIDPQIAGTRSAAPPTITVRGSLKTRQIVGRLEAPAGLLSLTVNDQSNPVNEQGVFQVQIPLGQPSIPVSVVAIDQQGKRSSVEFILQSEFGNQAPQPVGVQREYTLPPVDFGDYHALVIGIDNYRNLPHLTTAVSDAEAVSDLLQGKYGFKVTKLLNATRYDILSALNDLREQLTSDDNLLIYYAGHGELDRVNMRGHWLPADAELENTANWLSNVAVTDILNIINARQILVVADSCYSGSLTRSALAQLGSAMTEQERLNWLKTMAKKRSRTVLTSGGLEPTLDEGGEGQSVFARALLDVLQNNNEVLDGRHLYQEVSARVAYAASRMRFEQVPEYAPVRHSGHEGGDFFLVPVL